MILLRWKEPYVPFTDVVDECLSIIVHSLSQLAPFASPRTEGWMEYLNPTRSIQDKSPFSRDMPMQFSVSSCFESHIHASHFGGCRKDVDVLLTGPAGFPFS